MDKAIVDEVILAHAIRTRSTNPWESARRALVLDGQNARVMLVNAAWLTVITYGPSFAVFGLRTVLPAKAPAPGIRAPEPGG